MKRPKSIKWLCWSVPLALVLLMLVPSRFCLSVSAYSVASEEAAGVRIVLISDLHGQKFGENNSRLIKKIAEQRPDLICVAGDMFDVSSADEEMYDYITLLSELVKLAPTFVSYGNAEKAFEEENDTRWVEYATEVGATVLEEAYADLIVDGQQLRIGGLYRYAFPQRQTEEEWEESDTYRFLSDFVQTDAYKILLCHRPDSFIFYDAYDDWDVDLLLCGHTHGGLVRLPFLGGLYVPDQGWFPKYDKGLYRLGNVNMVIGAGLAGHGRIPRVLNLPDIVRIELT